VRARTLIAALLVTGVWALARSKPARVAEPAVPARQIKLVDDGSANLPVVSALEAGRPAELAPARKAVARVAGPEKAAAIATAEVAPAEPVPNVRPSISSTTEPMHHMAMEPLPVAQAPGLGTLASSGDFDRRSMPTEHSRDPAIIIRGGMGGARDDCDLHRRGGFGIAINRSAPMMGGIELGSNPMPLPRGTRIR